MVEVDGVRYQGTSIVLASGSYTRSLPGLEIDGQRVLGEQRGAPARDGSPSDAVVLGGGVIGVEFASAWRSLGAEVTIVEALPRLVAGEDAACSKAVERAFRKRGIKLLTGTAFESVEQDREGCDRVGCVRREDLDADLLLVAVGRGPTTAGLGYEETGSVWTAVTS